MLNKVILQGRLTADPELKMTNSGVSVTQFTLAVERDYQSNGKRETDFINVVAWKGTAEFASKYFSKGKMMLLSGRLEVRNYTAADGSKRYVTEVIADNVYFAGDKGESKAEAKPYGESGNEFEEMTPEEELPF